jgi:hypothetical protein
VSVFAVDRDGYGPVEIPCPEYYEGEFLSSFLSPQSNDSDEMAIDPQWPWDQAMLAERDWPHDQAIVREIPPGSERQPGDSVSQTANRAITIVRGAPTPPIRLKPEASE